MNTLPELRHLSLSLWATEPLAASPGDPAAMAALKTAVMRKGVNSRGWRLYLDYGDALFDALGRPWIGSWQGSQANEINALAFLRLLQACEMDVLPPAALLRSMARWQIPDRRLDQIPPLFFRAAWKMCMVGEYTQAKTETWIETRIVPVCQWFFATRQHLKADHNQLKAGWALLERRYQEFLTAQRRQAVQLQAYAPSPAEWLTPVLRAEFDGLLFTALSSELALQAEGEIMGHCIGGYAQRCRTTSLRAYSVAHAKARQAIATVTVIYSPGLQNWGIDDIKGPENAEVSDRLLNAAFGLLRCLDDATAHNPQVRQELHRLGSRSRSHMVLIDGYNWGMDMDDFLPF